MKTAVLIHGCHLQAKDWGNIVWGDPLKGILGRIPKGLRVALQEDAELVYWGTGASEKDGVKESQYTFNYATSRLSEFFSDYFEGDRYGLRDFIGKRSCLDILSQTTKEEIFWCMEVCLKRDIDKLILVSSPDHVLRAHQYAMGLRSVQREKYKDLYISAEGSDVRFAGSEPGDVLIVEPPHRGDRAEIPLHKTLKLAMFARKLDEEKAFKFNEDLAFFLEEQRRELMT